MLLGSILRRFFATVETLILNNATMKNNVFSCFRGLIFLPFFDTFLDHSHGQKNNDFYFLFGSQNGPKMIPKVIQKQTSEMIQKKSLIIIEKVPKMAQKGTPLSHRGAPKITTIPEILKKGPRASKMSSRTSKMTKNHDSDLPKSRKSHCKLLVFCTLVFSIS